MQTHVKLTGLSILTALLLTLAWPPIGVFPLAFVAFVPLFYIHFLVIEQKLGNAWLVLYGFITFLLFNIGTTWWIWNASAGGAVMAFVLNALLMVLPLLFIHKLGIKQNNPTKLWPFIWAWLAFEYFHFRWDGTWTWLTLGNLFSGTPWLIQWYEYTGVAGGTLWILWVNKSIFHWILAYNHRDKPTRFKTAFNLVFFKLFAPAFLSVYISNQYDAQLASAKRITTHVMVVQPNIDPYKEKFGQMSAYDQTVKMLEIAEANMDSTIEFIAFPETALVGHLDERNLDHEETIMLIEQFMRKHPNVGILTGADSYKAFLTGEKVSETARTFENGVRYDVYNTAFFLNPTARVIGIYHKSKLVPGVERLPFSSVLKYVEKYAIDLGGTTGSLGIDEAPSVFELNTMVKPAPIICYESIFGEYVTQYVKRGATLLCIVTNDGWWGNTPGYKQHFSYASLRAIETRRFVARSANTGISGFVDDKGVITKQTGWWVPAALKQKVALNTHQTFYVKHGDYMNELGILLTLYFFIGLVTTSGIKMKTW